MNPVIRLSTAVAAFTIILAVPRVSAAVPIDECDPWSEVVEAIACPEPGYRDDWCYGIAPDSVTNTCNVCSFDCQEHPEVPGAFTYECYATHEEVCNPM
jgi:hypothetical protein